MPLSRVPGVQKRLRLRRIALLALMTAIPVVLFYVFILAFVERGEPIELALRILRDVAIWGTVIVTLWSGVEYLPRRPKAVQREE